MSYIRCLSNPEGLYIYGNTKGQITISHNIPSPRAKPGYVKGEFPPEIVLPQHIFHYVCQRWNNGNESIKYRGCKVKEEYIEWKNGKKISNNITAEELLTRNVRREYLIKFEYKGKWFYMWRVTWKYIVRNVCNRY